MTSLVPGALFRSSGLNRNSTPTPPNITPSQLDARYQKGDCDGKTWPHDSPVSRIYDVQNTSTKMIILNNKYGQSGTRLRGYYTGPQKPDRTVDPNRHRASSPRNPEYHYSCYDSSSPKFEPTIKVNLEWSNNDMSKRNENSLAVKNSVNQRRHTSCQTPRESMRIPSEDRHRIPIPPARFFSAKEFSDMSLGEKLYMWSIERIYNVENMKKLKQDQYKKLLQLEAKKGYHGYQEYQKYMRYISSATSRSYGNGTPRSPQSPAGSRSRSAFSARSPTSPNKTESKQDLQSNKTDETSEEQSRPKTALGNTRSDSPTKDQNNITTKEQRSKSPPKSPSPSRKSSARSTKSAYSNYSHRSIQSKHSYRPPSTSSSKHSMSLRKVESSDSAFSAEGEMDSKHKEGRDRPKSRLGHMTPEDRDRSAHHSSLSSLSSIRSDKPTTSDDSGKDKAKPADKEKDKGSTNEEKKREPRKISTSSRGSRSSLGSSISLGSRHSSSSIDPQKKKDSQTTAQPIIRGTPDKDKDRTVAKPSMIHRVPSGTFEKESSDTNDEASKSNKKPENKITLQDNQANDATTKNENKVIEGAGNENQIKTEGDQEKSNDKQDTKQETLKDNETAKADTKEVADGGNEKADEDKMVVDKPVDKTDDQSKTEVKEERMDKPEATAETSDTPAERKDSLEEEDEDRRVNKDLDKIEY